jgi:hypothetical protein
MAASSRGRRRAASEERSRRAPYKLRTLDEVALFLAPGRRRHALRRHGRCRGRSRSGAAAGATVRDRAAPRPDRIGVLLVAAGLVLAVACGFWLLDLTEFDLGDAWVATALALMVWKP